MKLQNRITRWVRINRAVRELSRLNNATLIDLGFDRDNIKCMVEDMIDSARPTEA